MKQHVSWLATHLPIAASLDDRLVVIGGARLVAACRALWTGRVEVLGADGPAQDAEGVIESVDATGVLIVAGEAVPAPARAIAEAAERRGVPLVVGRHGRGSV
ncbi:MAG: hypothetical protein U0974_11855 [Gemmatimonadales bacterium]|nr:hypothetical protein [Gemmatimonadales bacterium]MDZ4390410.1 hypothetical protein [Gemmatimonadales bacterium]